MPRITLISFLVLLLTALAQSATLHVPTQYPTIQAGINASADGDTVLVADGVYAGAGNKNLDYLGKAIVVISEHGPESCVIDCENSGRGFYFHSGEEAGSVVTGFTITQGFADDGGGIYCSLSSPIIENCHLISNRASGERGGGMSFWYSSTQILNCDIIENSTVGSMDGYGYGGGMWCYESNIYILNCLFRGNIAESSWITTGGGIHCGNSELLVRFTIFEENEAANGQGGGICAQGSSAVIVENCTFYDNVSSFFGAAISVGLGPDLSVCNSIIAGHEENVGIHLGTNTGTVTLSFNDFYDNPAGNVEGLIPPGFGQIVNVNANDDSCDVFSNLFMDPLFDDPGSGNFQLTWANYPVPDSTMSPCIDAGDPRSPYDPDGTLADLGAFYYDQLFTVIPPGPVSGVWDFANSPYLITGEITVPAGETLVIQPGVEVRFQGHYKFIVNGFLEAVGTPSDSILFTASNTTEGWHGLRFIDAPDSSHLSYCIIRYGRASGSSWDHYGGGVFCYNSDPAIQHCTFYDNDGGWAGGAIFCYANAHPLIENCSLIENNAGSGGGISCGAEVTIRGCLIAQNSSIFGGGIYCSILSQTIETCTITENSAVDGGGVYIWAASPVVDSCVVSENIATEYGGGLYIGWDSEATLRYCTITENSAQQGGGVFTDKSTQFIDYCTLSRNSATNCGGGIYLFWAAQGWAKNSIFEGNENGGIYFNLSIVQLSVLYNDLYNNQGGNFTGDVPPGLGLISGLNHNGDPCDVYNNIFGNPLFEDPDNGNYQITWDNWPYWDSTRSVCVDAGDPSSPHDPDSTIADLGAFYFHQEAPVTVSLIPAVPPIVIPYQGGSFNYTIQVTNQGIGPIACETWIMVEMPGGVPFGPVWGPMNLHLAGGQMMGRNRSQYVPGNAPTGSYVYIAKVGDYPTGVWAQDSFIFEKKGGLWSDSFEDGNYTQNPPWEHVSGFTEVVVFDEDHCLDVHGTDGGNTNGVIQAEAPVAQEFSLEFDIYRRAPSSDWQNIQIGFNEGGYAVNTGFHLMENDCNNLRTYWNGTQLNMVPIASFDYRWQHVQMHRDSTGFWNIIWDEGGPNQTTITGQDQFGTLQNPYLWILCSPHYGATQGAYFDDLLIWDVQPHTAVDLAGELADWMTNEPSTPKEYSLSQNFPNPFNATTAISYNLQASSYVRLQMYNTAGRLVQTLVDGFREAGSHTVTINGSGLPSGLYFYCLQAGDFIAVKKMVLVK